MACVLRDDIPHSFYLLFACNVCIKLLKLTPILSAAYVYNDLECTVCGNSDHGKLIVETDEDIYERKTNLLKL